MIFQFLLRSFALLGVIGAFTFLPTDSFADNLKPKSCGFKIYCVCNVFTENYYSPSSEAAELNLMKIDINTGQEILIRQQLGFWSSNSIWRDRPDRYTTDPASACQKAYQLNGLCR